MFGAGVIAPVRHICMVVWILCTCDLRLCKTTAHKNIAHDVAYVVNGVYLLRLHFMSDRYSRKIESECNPAHSGVPGPARAPCHAQHISQGLQHEVQGHSRQPKLIARQAIIESSSHRIIESSISMGRRQQAKPFRYWYIYSYTCIHSIYVSIYD